MRVTLRTYSLASAHHYSKDLMMILETRTFDDPLRSDVGRLGGTKRPQVLVLADLGECVHEPASHSFAAELGTNDEAKVSEPRSTELRHGG